MRMELLQPPYDATATALFQRWMGNQPVEPLMLFRLFATHPVLMDRLEPLGMFQLSRAAGLDLRTRELLIDRSCARCGCEYEWGIHVAIFGAKAKLTGDEIAATVVADPTLPNDRDRALLQLVDELHDNGAVSDSLWSLLVTEWSQQQILEMLVLIGWYHMISFVANAAKLTSEPWANRFPSP